MSILRKQGHAHNVVGSDVLASMNDYELQYRINKLHNELQSAISRERQLHAEVELAYCQRELQIRKAQYDAHAEYVSRNIDGDDDLNAIDA